MPSCPETLDSRHASQYFRAPSPLSILPSWSERGSYSLRLIPLVFRHIASLKQSWCNSSFDLWSMDVLKGKRERGFLFFREASGAEKPIHLVTVAQRKQNSDICRKANRNQPTCSSQKKMKNILNWYLHPCYYSDNFQILIALLFFLPACQD